MEASEFLNAGFCRAGNPQLESKSGEHFIVEDLLDFSNEDDDHLVVETAAGDDGTYDHAACNYTDSSTVTAFDSCNSSFSSSEPHLSGKIPFRSYADDLCLPYDELAELEWLSNFVEESFSSQDFQKLQLSSGTKAGNNDISEIGEFPGSKSRNNPIFRRDGLVPGKARSKRSRAAPCNWSSRLLVVSPATSSSESDAAVNSGKKSTSKKKEATTAEASGGDGRKCLHCATDKTPQWRTGPMGPKTLCNACGVRYKSGRLVPEYRPAASPTFVLTKHSNCHRKVLELRRQKGLLQQQQFLHPNAAFDIVGGDEYLIHAPFSKANLMIGGPKKMDFW